MVWKRKRSSVWQLGPFRAGTVDVPRLSTGQTNKVMAEAVSNSLKELAVTGWVDLVERVARGDLTLVALYTAKIGGAAALQALRDERLDPLLEPTARRFREEISDRRHREG